MRMREYLGFLLISMLVLGVSAFSQDEKKEEEPKYGWSKQVVGNLNFTQSSFDNWSQGGEDSWAWLLGFNARVENDQPKTNWRNIGKVEYGQSKIGDASSRKSADEIFLESVLSYKMKFHVNPYIAVNGRTQIASGYAYAIDASNQEIRTEISKFLNPGYFMESVGFEYRKEETFRSRLGFALKQTLVTEEQFAPLYTDESNTEKLEKIRSEAGLESVSAYNRKITPTIVYATSLEVFSNMKAFDQIDTRWDNLISAEVAKYVAVSFAFQIFYDRDLSIKRQLKQVLAVGLTYNFL